MHLLRASDYREMPWKNGGGTTTEIAAYPPGASLDSFDWRISMARVEGGGSFSLFTGIDRTLAILAGDGINLTIGGAIPVGLDTASQPLSFPADVPTHATLVGGPVTDLNVMTRRGRMCHSMKRVTLSGETEIPLADDVTLVFRAHGALAVLGEKPLRLREFDTLWIDGQSEVLRLEAIQKSVVFVVGFSRVDHAR